MKSCIGIQLAALCGLFIGGCASTVDVKQSETQITEALKHHDENMGKQHIDQANGDLKGLKEHVDASNAQLQADLNRAKADLEKAREEHEKLAAALEKLKGIALTGADLLAGGRVKPLVDALSNTQAQHRQQLSAL